MSSFPRLLALLILFATPALADGNKLRVVVYDGWGTPESIAVSGRVLEDKGERAPVKGAGAVENLGASWDAIESDEVRYAQVTIDVSGQRFTATTDVDGNFVVRARRLPRPLPLGEVPVTVTVQSVPGRKTSRLQGRSGDGKLFIHAASTPFVAIVSDVDDTIVQTHVTDKARLLATALFDNAAELEPVAGAARNYRCAQAAGVSGFFYLSGSPQNFYTRIRHYLGAHGFPDGPLLLKNFSKEPLFQQEGYKLARLETLLSSLPAMRVILVGDNGERDPEIYAALRSRHPGRVVGIVIRDTLGIPAAAKPAASHAGAALRAERLQGMTVVRDSYANDDVIAALLAKSTVPCAAATGASAVPAVTIGGIP